ncbi:hypothetical protein BCV69DRAFT_259778 [Microstroma glucosiphilum]|uniref:Fe2OG dioxygenase domain-containing protein n=1 Tax=Pseudomicrostroma glucosiphilum TaxID=1684307 RepID=A0A316U725_9BASI|nr:hypothetical protein BCV69DRAFT_259778 [Pseudomicrostroma glucosiphilum]PWN20644.1 hypothetical protein BCV69DRAFT_259778 [Pseudomicrostroma glucosiphilum]
MRQTTLRSFRPSSPRGELHAEAELDKDRPRKRVKVEGDHKDHVQDVNEEDLDNAATRSLSPSPPPPRIPTDFKQVTSPSFLAKTSTPIPGVHYLPSLIPPSLASEWYHSLLSLEGWYHPTLRMYGKEITQSRAIIAFSKVPGLKLKYSGQEVEMREWPEVLRGMERRCREVIGEEVRFNHAMLNWYADGDTHIGRHSDNLENKVIVTLSLGAPRTWVMTKRPPKGAQAAAKRNGVKLAKTETHKWTVEAGSLLLMQGKCQEEWYHEIPKERKIKEGRISVTLRQLVYD